MRFPRFILTFVVVVNYCLDSHILFTQNVLTHMYIDGPSTSHSFS